MAAALSQFAKSASAMSNVASIIPGTKANTDYKVSKQKTTDEIIVTIIEILKEKYFCNSESSNKALIYQIGEDLQQIYYDDYDTKDVNQHIKTEIIQCWYRALRTRLEEILKEKPQATHGGASDTTTTRDHRIITFAKIHYSVFMEKLGKKGFSNSKSVRNVYNLHNKIIKKVACNYAIINRPDCERLLQKIISEMYGLFDKQLSDLSNNTMERVPSSIVKQNNNTPNTFGGEKSNELYPTEYDFSKIEKEVSSKLQSLLTEKLYAIKPDIEPKFKQIFYNANRDCLNFNDAIMKEYLNAELSAMLEYLCKGIDKETAKRILGNYILRNKADPFWNKLFTIPVDNMQFHIFQLNYIYPLLFDNPDIVPENTFELVVNSPDDSASEYNAEIAHVNKPSLNNKCELGSTPGLLLEIFKTDNSKSELKFIRRSIITEAFNSFDTFFNEITSKVKDCEEPDSNPNHKPLPFLCELFHMYSNKSIAFIKIIQDQFTDNSAITLDYIERYILTKHLDTKEILIEIIKHIFDVRKLMPDNNDHVELIEYFAKLVELKCISYNFDANNTQEFVNQFEIVNGVNSRLHDMVSGLMNHLDENIKKTYINDLQTMFPSQ